MDSRTLADEYFQQGRTFYVEDRWEDALNAYLKALDLYKKDPARNYKRYTASLNEIGVCYFYLKKFDAAIENYLKAYQEAQTFYQDFNIAKDHSFLAVCYNNIGGAFKKKKNIEKAIYYYECAVKILEKMPEKDLNKNDYGDLFDYYYDLAEAFFLKECYTDAMQAYQKSIALQSKVGAHSEACRNLARCYNGIGKIYFRDEKWQDALLQFNLAKEELKEVALTETDKRFLAFYYKNIAYSHARLNNNDQVMRAYEEVALIRKSLLANSIKATDFLELARAYHELGLIFFMKEDYMQAYPYFLSSIDSLYQLLVHPKASKKNDCFIELAKNYDKLKVIFSCKYLEHELFGFAHSVFAGHFAMFSYFSSIALAFHHAEHVSNAQLSYFLQFCNMVKAVLKQDNFPDTSFKLSLQDASKFAVFEKYIELIQKQNEKLLKITSHHPSLMIGLVNELADLEQTNDVLRKDINDLKQNIETLQGNSFRLFNAQHQSKKQKLLHRFQHSKH